MDPLIVFVVCTLANILIILPIFVFLDLAFDRLFRIGWLRRHIQTRIESARRSAEATMERYGLLGLAAFVAIPLPGTGAYTGCLAAFLLGMDRRKASLAVALGVLGAGIMVTAASVGVLKALKGGLAGLAVLVVAVLCVCAYAIRRRKKAEASAQDSEPEK